MATLALTRVVALRTLALRLNGDLQRRRDDPNH